ncbi:MAG: polyphosphate kinase 2 family protein [Acidimicrobiales bacterium]
MLLVLQATDTGGKDGTIRHVFDGVNPQGVRVASFKKPTDNELAHDYLWRVHKHAPSTGEMVIFNRSHYEDVLVVRVHGWISEEKVQQRFHHIREFERLLQSRLDEPKKNWKFATSDLDERKLWDDYQKAFADTLSQTSTDYAPWYVIPADRKWFRNLLISRIVVDNLEGLDMAYPSTEDGLSDIVTD